MLCDPAPFGRGSERLFMGQHTEGLGSNRASADLQTTAPGCGEPGHMILKVGLSHQVSCV